MKPFKNLFFLQLKKLITKIVFVKVISVNKKIT